MARTILIVDDNAIIRRSLRHCIEQNSDWEVCGEAENGRVAVEMVEKLVPDVVLLDLQMPVMNGFEAAYQINRIAPRIVLLMLTLHASEQVSLDARAAGIKHVLSKSDDVAERLLASLKAV